MDNVYAVMLSWGDEYCSGKSLVQLYKDELNAMLVVEKFETWVKNCHDEWRKWKDAIPEEFKDVYPSTSDHVYVEKLEIK